MENKSPSQFPIYRCSSTRNMPARATCQDPIVLQQLTLESKIVLGDRSSTSPHQKQMEREDEEFARQLQRMEIMNARGRREYFKEVTKPPPPPPPTPKVSMQPRCDCIENKKKLQKLHQEQKEFVRKLQTPEKHPNYHHIVPKKSPSEFEQVSRSTDLIKQEGRKIGRQICEAIGNFDGNNSFTKVTLKKGSEEKKSNSSWRHRKYVIEIDIVERTQARKIEEWKEQQQLRQQKESEKKQGGDKYCDDIRSEVVMSAATSHDHSSHDMTNVMIGNHSYLRSFSPASTSDIYENGHFVTPYASRATEVTKSEEELKSEDLMVPSSFDQRQNLHQSCPALPIHVGTKSHKDDDHKSYFKEEEKEGKQEDKKGKDKEEGGKEGKEKKEMEEEEEEQEVPPKESHHKDDDDSVSTNQKKIPAEQTLTKDEAQKDEECGICGELLVEGDRVRTLSSCLHTFHLICFDRFMILSSTTSTTNCEKCPVCGER